MSVQDITPDLVLAAIQAGYDDKYKLAEHFGVLHTLPALQSAITDLSVFDRIRPTNVPGFFHSGEQLRYRVV